MRLHQPSDPGDNEYACFFGFFDRGVGQVLKKCRRRFIVHVNLLCKVTDQLGLGHASCHESSSASEIRFSLNALVIVIRLLCKKQHNRRILRWFSSSGINKVHKNGPSERSEFRKGAKSAVEGPYPDLSPAELP
jgi:hypothetical protein